MVGKPFASGVEKVKRLVKKSASVSLVIPEGIFFPNFLNKTAIKAGSLSGGDVSPARSERVEVWR